MVSLSLAISYLPIDPSTPNGNCSMSDIRIIDSEDQANGTKQGRLEVCINNAWGSVCRDSFLDNVAAEVVCQQMGGFYRESMCCAHVQV